MSSDRNGSRRWQVSREKVVLFGVIVLVLAANVAFFLYFYPSSRSDSHLAFGAPFPRFQGTALDGTTISWENRWGLISFSNSSNANGIRHIRYAVSLAERFRDKGLVSVGILQGGREGIEREPQFDQLKGALIWDESGDWAKVLRLSGHQAGFFLVDPSGSTVFSSLRVRDEDLRLLVESNVLGKVDYSGSLGATFLEPGGRLPRLEVSSLRTRRTFSLQELRADFVVLFSAECAICSLDGHLTRYQELVASAGQKGLNVIAVFSANFLAADFAEHGGADPVALDSIYIATSNPEEPGGVYNFRSPRGSADVLALRVSSDGEIDEVGSMEEALEKLQ